ncbi:MAG: hypothetical protein EBR27_13465 [Betaproteobacteria bacterium]|nr:hypothetical protein [Betaproteobacteria bacterium]
MHELGGADCTDRDDRERVLHRKGLPFLVACTGWCRGAGAAGAYFPSALEDLLDAHGWCASDASRADWLGWLRIAVPAAATAALAWHDLGEAVANGPWVGPRPRRPDWDDGAPRGDGSYAQRPPRLAWETSHSVVLAPDETGEGWTLTVWGPRGGSYRVVAAESAMRAAEKRLELRAD